jgi:hypothetical protein
MVQNQAESVARERLRPVAHSMSLEDQTVEEPQNKLQLALATKALLEGSRRELW